MRARVFTILQSCHSERPKDVYRDPNDSRFSGPDEFRVAGRNEYVSTGERRYPAARWMVPKLLIGRKGKTPLGEWDYYMGYTFGLFSPRAIEFLSPYFGNRFDTLPATLEGHAYHCLRCCRRNDCLDEDESSIENGKVMSFDVLSFRDNVPDDPAIFAIPEDRTGLYCTQSVPKLVKAAGLRGFRFRPAGKKR